MNPRNMMSSADRKCYVLYESKSIKFETSNRAEYLGTASLAEDSAKAERSVGRGLSFAPSSAWPVLLAHPSPQHLQSCAIQQALLIQESPVRALGKVSLIYLKGYRFKGILVCNRLSMSFPASGPSCILQSYLFTYTPSLAPCSQASAGQDPKSNHCQAFPAGQQTWKKKHLPYMLSRLLLFWRISCELVSAPHLALHQSIFWDEIRVTMRVLEMDHNCLTSAYNTASRSPREQVFPDIRTSHPQRQRLVQLIGRGGSRFGTERAEG